MYRAIQKLVRNGNSTQVTIPADLLRHLGWLPAELVVIELLEDESLRVRRPDAREFAPKRTPRLVLENDLGVKV